jgi:RND family efflux transporter MFP subunit
MTYNKISLILITFLFLTGCRNNISNNEALESAVPVITEQATLVRSAREISLSGNIEGYKTVRLGFLVAGKIDFIAVNEGHPVSKGQLLSSLDPTNYGIAKELADIQVNQVQDEYNRLKLMHDSNSLSESDFAKITYGLQQAKAQQKLHTKNLADTKLYSPISGILLKKLAEVGEITGVGIPIFAVSDIRRVKVSAFVPENELHSIRIGQTATVNIPSLDKNYEGKITEVGSAADPASRAFSVKIEIENPGMLIRPGMIAQVSLRSDEDRDMLVIPVSALLHDFNDVSYIFVVDTVRNKAFRRDVSTGLPVNDRIEIRSGLSPDDIIVTGGQQKLVDGSQVIITK